MLKYHVFFCSGCPLMPDFFLDEFDAAAIEQAQELGAKPKFYDGKVVESEKPKAGQVAQVLHLIKSVLDV